MLQTILIVIHLLIAVFLVGIILIQQSEGGGLGLGGGGGGGGGFMTARGTANFLTRTTGILAGVFMVTSLALAVLASRGAPERKSILDVPAAPIEAPTQPSVPLAK